MEEALLLINDSRNSPLPSIACSQCALVLKQEETNSHKVHNDVLFDCLRSRDPFIHRIDLYAIELFKISAFGAYEHVSIVYISLKLDHLLAKCCYEFRLQEKHNIEPHENA